MSPSRSLIKQLVPNSILHRHLPSKAGDSIALTFDDGPHPDLTPKILDMLEKHDARGCFFVVGKFAEEHSNLLEMIINRGHLLGNHTYDHPREGYTSFDQERSS